MAPKTRAARVEPLREFPLKSGGKYRFNLEGESEVRCPNYPRCPTPSGEPPEEWRRVEIPFGKALKEYGGGCAPCARSAKKKTDPVSHRSGAVILRAVRDPANNGHAAYLCWDCCPPFARVEAWFAERGVDIKTAPNVTAEELVAALRELGAECDEVHYIEVQPAFIERERRARWSGRDARCRDRARFNWIELKDGGWVRRDYEDPTMGWMICRDCGPAKQRHVKMPSGKNRDGAARLCKDHSGIQHRTRRQIKNHESGAILLERVRDPERPKDRAAFICSNWAGKPADERPSDCLRVDFGWFNQFDDDTWGGRCKICARRFENHQHVLKTDQPVLAWKEAQGPDGPFVELIAWIRYSKGDENEVPVWFGGCKEEVTLRRAYVMQLKSLHKRQKVELSKWCPPCGKDSNRLAATLQAQAQNGNGHSGGEKHQTGRPPAQSENDKFLAAVDELITNWHRERPAARLPSPQLADKLSSEKSIHMPDNTLRKKIKRLTGKKYDDYFELVASRKDALSAGTK